MSQTKSRIAGRDDGPARMPDRDPAKVYSRSGREVSLRFTGSEDKFNLDAMGIRAPDGWTYEWKTKSIKGWEWTSRQVEAYQNGWEPVPADRHDGLIMPPGHKGAIEIGGQILMERPAELTRQARLIEKRMADDPVKQSRSMAGLMSRQVPGINAIGDFSHPAARGATGVNIERSPVRSDGKYTLEE